MNLPKYFSRFAWMWPWAPILAVALCMLAYGPPFTTPLIKLWKQQREGGIVWGRSHQEQASPQPIAITTNDPSYQAGFHAGMVQANRRTLDRAIALMDTFKIPIDYLTAGDVVGIIGECAVPRDRDPNGDGVERYETTDGDQGWVSIRLNREKLVDPQKTNDGRWKMFLEGRP